jgi:mannose-6-phosphate isomerase-like protein (cupin superfamily)
MTTCGESIIAPLAPYPPIEHPPSHHFDWQHGRRLSEYQIVYVSEGAGTIETGKAAFRVAAGDAILLAQSAREGTPGLRQILAG